jgi:hypothetical protein
MMKFSDFALGLVILIGGGAVGIVVLLHLGLTLPILEKDAEKFFGVGI